MKAAPNKGKQHVFIFPACCVVINLIGFVLYFIASKEDPLILGIGLTAYLLGLRHAFDADHIAAIDNTVRKLIAQKQDANGVGFYFSLGHSTVVIIMSILLNLFMHWSQQHLSFFQQIGHWVGSMISSLFLISIGIANTLVFLRLRKDYLDYKAHQDSEKLDNKPLLLPQGPLTMVFHGLFRLVNRSYQIYPIGFLFGLGFDTTTEVSLLALSAGVAKHAVSFTGLLALPLLFTSGMVIVDSLDSILMSGAYKQALRTPVHRFYYNMIVTGLSVMTALFIGMTEWVQIGAEQFHWHNTVSTGLQKINFSQAGYGLALLFIVIWVVGSLGFRKNRSTLQNKVNHNNN